MENNEELKRIKLFMNYDSKMTLKENERKIGKVLLEYKKGTANLGNWCATTDYNLGSDGMDYTLKKGSCFTPKSDAGPNAWAYCSADPFASDDPLVFDCAKKNPDPQNVSKTAYLWEPSGTGNFWDQELRWELRKLYYNNQLEDSLKTHFCVVPKVTAPVVKTGGGGTGTGNDKIVTTSKSTNMANNSMTYWKTLYNQLIAANYDVRTGGKEVEDTDEFTIGKFTIARDNSPFICLNCASWETTKADTYVQGDISKRNTTPNKYSGEVDLNKVLLLVKNTETKEFISLIDFLALDGSKSKTKDNTGNNNASNKTNNTGNSNASNKTGNVSPVSSSWNTTCKGTYSMGCNTPEVGQAQQCLKDANLYPYRVDNKFGKLTRNAVNTKIGKSSFTDADLQTICKAKEGSGGNDFDKDMGAVSDEKEKEDTAWTGNVY